MNEFDMTLKDWLKFAESANSAVTTLKINASDKTRVAFVLIRGVNECEEILPVIEKIQDAWDNDNELLR